MARGKQTCKILKEIRRQIAEANDIEFVTSECRYKGDCLGTCPKCEAEVRYLEQQLRERASMGKSVALAGISAGLIFMAGCGGGGTSSNQTNPPEPAMMGDIAMPVEQVEEVDAIEEGELAATEDSILFVSKDLQGVKAGEVADIDTTIGSRGENTLPVDTVAINDEGVDETADIKLYGAVAPMPTFPGGEAKLMEWVSQHLIYPPNAMDANITGRVVVQFRIEEDGSIGDVKIARSVCDDLDNEAMRVVKLLPKFNPATMNGKTVACWYTLPITFRLTE